MGVQLSGVRHLGGALLAVLRIGAAVTVFDEPPRVLAVGQHYAYREFRLRAYLAAEHYKLV